MIDRHTKMLLAAIATGLWLNVVATLIRPAAADSYVLTDMERHLRSIDGNIISIDGHIQLLTQGTCANRRLC